MPDDIDGELEDEDSEGYEEYLAAQAEAAEEFKEMYGFDHDCHCKEDWEEGNVGLVSECYTKMVNEALKQCHLYKGEVAELERSILLLQMQIREMDSEPRV